MIASLPASKRRGLIKSKFSPEEAERLIYTWKFWARPKQLPPRGDWYVWMYCAGRGSGKTRTGAGWIHHSRAMERPRWMALIAKTPADARDFMIEGPGGILRNSHPAERPDYEPSKRRLTWPNGSIATIYSSEDPDQVRGFSGDTAWLDEFCKFKHPREIYDNLQFGMREVGGEPQVFISTTPKPLKILKEIIAQPDTVTVTGSSYENRTNLHPRFIEKILARYEGTRLGEQEIHARILSDNPRALWSRELLEKTRVREAPELIRVVVAIDPQAKHDEERTGEDQEGETGIVVAGLAANGHGYVLDDISISAKPNGWASQALAGYHKHRADLLVGERNNGGDMVENTIRTIEPNASFSTVWASRGKTARAEPVSSLYEQCVSKGTYIRTPKGETPIEDISAGEMVWTRQGLRRVLWAGQTGIKPTLKISTGEQSLTCTESHPIYVEGKGFISAGQLAPKYDIIKAWDQNINALAAEQLCGILTGDADRVLRKRDGRPVSRNGNMWNSTGLGITSRGMDIGGLAAMQEMSCYTGRFGEILMEKFLKVGTFTTRTKTQTITAWKIWLLSALANIHNSTTKMGLEQQYQLKLFANGYLKRKKAGGKKESIKNISAMNAGGSLPPELPASVFVPPPATRLIGIKSVEKNKEWPVYNLMVDKDPEFFANGVLVHNCKVHHVGFFPELEDEQCEWVDDGKHKSPNRLDAVVWALTELMLGEEEETDVITYGALEEISPI